ncbi:MAG TPA: LuxR C-terminal-related transcriptional regulator, partial [Solirubrobacteraceae bacterium]
LLRPLDAPHDRYRWHCLFRDALRAELRRAEPKLAQSLHRRASSWYDGRGDVDRAITHLVSAHDCVRAGDLLWAHIVAYVTQGRNEIVQRWLRSFSHDELAEHAPLALSAAHSFLAAGDAAQARHWAVAAAAAMDRGQMSPGTASLTAGLAGIEAMMTRAGVGGMEAAAARVCALEPDDSPWRPICLFLHGTALHLTGDRAAAMLLLDEGVDLSAAYAPTVTALCLAQAAMIAIEQRDWEAAAELTDRARQVIEDRGLAEDPILALAFAASAASRAHHGRADEAKQDLRRSIDLLTVLGDFAPWYGAQARILLAHASLWLADVVRARTLLAEASRLARKTPGAVIFERWFEEAWSYMDALAETSLAGPSSLTIAELRILRFLPSHRSFREIAGQLGVSANTVKTQAHAVYRKLGAASRSEAVAHALDAGLLGQ